MNIHYNNAKFCKKYDSKNKDLKKKIEKIEKQLKNGIYNTFNFKR